MEDKTNEPIRNPYDKTYQSAHDQLADGINIINDAIIKYNINTKEIVFIWNEGRMNMAIDNDYLNTLR